MSTFNYTPVVDGSTSHASDVNTPFAAIATVLNGGVDSTNITAGSLTDTSFAASASPVTRYRRQGYDYVYSGGVIATSASLSSTITAAVMYINGKEVLVGGQAITVVASKDTYVYIKDDGTVVQSAVTNNAASPAATTNADATTALLLAIVISSGTAITTVNQGEETKVLPIASSIPYAVTDSLGNLICPRDPNRKLLGMRQRYATFSTASATAVQITELSVPVIVPSGRKVKVSMNISNSYASAAAGFVTIGIYDGVVGGTPVARAQGYLTSTSDQKPLAAENVITPSVSSKTYNGSFASPGAVTMNLEAGASFPITLKVELE